MARTVPKNDPQRYRCYDWEHEHVYPLDHLAQRGPAPRAKDFITCPALRACVELRPFSSIRYDDLTKHERATFLKAGRAYARLDHSPKLGYLTLDDAQLLVNRALKRWRVFDMNGNVRSVDVVAGRGSTAWASLFRISLPRWARRPSVVLHEVAHCIAGHHYHEHNHGPEYMAIYVDLLHTFLDATKSDLRRTAKAAPYNLRFAPGVACYGADRSPGPREITVNVSSR